jgi:hypothetical protein
MNLFDRLSSQFVMRYGAKDEIPFSESITDKTAFDQFGDLYAEYVESQLAESPDTDHVYLYGISMGASFATKTAERLLRDGHATQDSKGSEKHVPYMQVRADVPVGFIDSSARTLEIPIGFFGIEGLYKLATDSYTRAAGPGEGKFVQQVNGVLAERGIHEQMSTDQKKMKNKALSAVAWNLIKGTSISSSLKVDVVRATHDPLVYSRSFAREAREQKAEHAGSIGENLVSPTKGHRTTAIDQTHSMVFFRENELRRILKAAESLKAISKSH